jgi:hypothetical protein
MARKLRPHEEHDLIKAAPQFGKTFRKGGCRAKKHLRTSIEPKSSEFSTDLPNWDECSWPDEWGW